MWEMKFNQHQPALQKRSSLLAAAPRCLPLQCCSSEELLDPPDDRSCHKPASPVNGSRSQRGSTIKRKRRVTVILLWQFLESCRPGNLQVWRQMNQNRHCLEARCKWRTNASFKKCFASSFVASGGWRHIKPVWHLQLNIVDVSPRIHSLHLELIKNARA